MEKKHKLWMLVSFLIVFSIIDIVLLIPQSINLIFAVEDYTSGSILFVISFGFFIIWGYDSLYDIITKREFHGPRRHRRKANAFIIGLFILPICLILGSWILIYKLAPLNPLLFIILILSYYIIPPSCLYKYKKINFEDTSEYKMNDIPTKLKDMKKRYEKESGKIAIIDGKDSKGFKIWKEKNNIIKNLPEIVLSEYKNIPKKELKRIPLFKIGNQDKEVAYIYHSLGAGNNKPLVITQFNNLPKKFLLKNVKIHLIFKGMHNWSQYIVIDRCKMISFENCMIKKLKITKSTFIVKSCMFKIMRAYKCKNSALSECSMQKFYDWDCVKSNFKENIVGEKFNSYDNRLNKFMLIICFGLGIFAMLGLPLIFLFNTK